VNHDESEIWWRYRLRHGGGHRVLMRNDATIGSCRQEDAAPLHSKTNHACAILNVAQIESLSVCEFPRDCFSCWRQRRSRLDLYRQNLTPKKGQFFFQKEEAINHSQQLPASSNKHRQLFFQVLLAFKFHKSLLCLTQSTHQCLRVAKALMTASVCPVSNLNP
jgi:hypothetical protein